MTTPHHQGPRDAARPRPRPVTIGASAFGLNPPVIASPCRLVGWSLSPAAQVNPAIAASLQGVAAAAATLTCTGFFAVSSVVVTPAAAWPAGANVVTVSNVTGGPIIIEIEGGTENPVILTFSPPVGVTGVPAVAVPAIAGGPAYTIDAAGLNSTSNAASTGCAATFVDAGQVLASVMMQPNISDTEMLGEEGIYVGTSIALNVSLGSLSGVIYVLDEWHGGNNLCRGMSTGNSR